MRNLTLTAAALLAGGTLLSTGLPASAQETFVTIGTGGVTGVYYPTGGAIQRLVNRGRAEHGVRVAVESTGGSVFNLNAIANGELDMGVAQSDWQYYAYNGGHENFPEANPELRSVFSLHGEPFTVLARADADIHTFEDLAGHRVNIGNPGSGQRGTMEVVMAAYGWDESTFSQVSELQSSEQAQALCDNNVDAIVFTVGHPSGSIQEATTTCDTRLIPVDGEVIDQLVADNPYYAYSIIPGGMYEGNPDDVRTFGVKATFVTSTALSDDVVYTIVAAVFDNFDQFRQLHPAFATLEPEQMIHDGLSAPLHDGAVRYYTEQGWM
ncbi:MAG: TAXI family TRAP transporter solute-binding subunit [Rhodospirillaceae bacterium]|nr:TAXI family TRAP transporter solute-binding subunit [Rhodospirillaceae bacterium]